MIRTTWHGRLDALKQTSTSMGSRLAKVNEEVATGKRINRASDEPGRISQLHNVRQQLNNQGVYMKNASQAEQLLNVADTALKDIHATLSEAESLLFNSPTRATMAFSVQRRPM